MRTFRFALAPFAAAVIAASAVATSASAAPPRTAPEHVAPREALPPVHARPAAVLVTAAEVRALGVKFASFRGRLVPSERALLDHIVARAAHVAPDDARGIARSVVFERPGADAAWIAGGLRGALGVITFHRPDPTGPLAIGPKQDDPRAPGAVAFPRPGGDVSIGPKQDDPRAPGRVAFPRPGGDVSIGPKQDDPRPPPPSDLVVQSLSEKLLGFEGALGLHDRAILGWLVNRASTARPTVAPGGLPASSPEGMLAAGLRVDASGGSWIVRPSDLVGVWYPIDRPNPVNRGGQQMPGPTDGPGSGVGPGAVVLPR